MHSYKQKYPINTYVYIYVHSHTHTHTYVCLCMLWHVKKNCTYLYSLVCRPCASWWDNKQILILFMRSTLFHLCPVIQYEMPPIYYKHQQPKKPGPNHQCGSLYKKKIQILLSLHEVVGASFYVLNQKSASHMHTLKINKKQNWAIDACLSAIVCRRANMPTGCPKNTQKRMQKKQLSTKKATALLTDC